MSILISYLEYSKYEKISQIAEGFIINLLFIEYKSIFWSFWKYRELNFSWIICSSYLFKSSVWSKNILNLNNFKSFFIIVSCENSTNLLSNSAPPLSQYRYKLQNNNKKDTVNTQMISFWCWLKWGIKTPRRKG